MDITPVMSFGAFGIVALFWGLFVTITWIVIGWRAMRAHERLAQAANDLARQGLVPPNLR